MTTPNPKSVSRARNAGKLSTQAFMRQHGLFDKPIREVLAAFNKAGYKDVQAGAVYQARVNEKKDGRKVVPLSPGRKRAVRAARPVTPRPVVRRPVRVRGATTATYVPPPHPSEPALFTLAQGLGPSRVAELVDMLGKLTLEEGAFVNAASEMGRSRVSAVLAKVAASWQAFAQGG